MSSPVLAVRPTNPVAVARNMMLSRKVKHLAVLERGKVVGVISISDIAAHIWREMQSRTLRPLESIPVSTLMSTELVSVSVGTDVLKAVRVMVQRGVGSVLVTDAGDVTGIVTETDVLRALVRSGGLNMKIGEIMKREFVSVGRRNSLSQALKRIITAGEKGAVVLEGERPVGIITGVDIAFASIEGVKEKKMTKFTRKIERAGRPMARHVREVFSAEVEDLMRPDLVTVSEEESAVVAAELIMKRGLTMLPVVRGDTLAGVITKSEILKALAGQERSL